MGKNVIAAIITAVIILLLGCVLAFPLVATVVLATALGLAGSLVIWMLFMFVRHIVLG